MIWVGGRVVPDEELKVSVLDRTFEHGLGLFETLATRNGYAPLLGRHLARMKGSAEALGLPYGSAMPPDEEAVSSLVKAADLGGDVMLRITLTGGLSETAGAALWMRALPLPIPMRRGGAVVEVGSWQVWQDDPLARHKSLNYWPRRLAYGSAQRVGFDEVLSITPEGVVWEGSRTNLFLIRGTTLTTPCLDGPLVPGVMRGLVLELAKELPLTVVETGDLRRRDLAKADEVFLTNSVRGIVPVARVVVTRPSGGPLNEYPAPGDWTQRLSILVDDWLRAGGTPP
jgi:branched-subunit amino acid aminotransferase/4-amino-4-deoxychorismate lyase